MQIKKKYIHHGLFLETYSKSLFTGNNYSVYFVCFTLDTFRDLYLFITQMCLGDESMRVTVNFRKKMALNIYLSDYM